LRPIVEMSVSFITIAFATVAAVSSSLLMMEQFDHERVGGSGMNRNTRRRVTAQACSKARRHVTWSTARARENDVSPAAH
jgi:hypothetical protein